jgi:hypothetical protein
MQPGCAGLDEASSSQRMILPSSARRNANALNGRGRCLATTSATRLAVARRRPAAVPFNVMR